MTRSLKSEHFLISRLRRFRLNGVMAGLLRLLLIFFFAYTSVLAHAGSYEHAGKAGLDAPTAISISCFDAGKDGKLSCNDTSPQGDQLADCDLMHCNFHVIFLTQGQNLYAGQLAGKHSIEGENQLFPSGFQRTKRPPRLIS